MGCYGRDGSRRRSAELTPYGPRDGSERDGDPDPDGVQEEGNDGGEEERGDTVAEDALAVMEGQGSGQSPVQRTHEQGETYERLEEGTAEQETLIHKVQSRPFPDNSLI